MPDEHRLSRRTFIELAGAAGVAAGTVSLASAPAGATPTTALTPPELQMTLRIARAGAVFPIAFPDYGEAGPATSRATMPRLRAAIERLPPDRLATAKAGAGDLLANKLADVKQPALLAGLGRLAAGTDEVRWQQLSAVVALAVSTVSTRFDPSDDEPARLWLSGLRALYEQGRLPRLAQERIR
jgi:hypothetical protein